MYVLISPFYNTNKNVLQPWMLQPYESYAADFFIHATYKWQAMAKI
jgi:hypothetical protein